MEATILNNNPERVIKGNIININPDSFYSKTAILYLLKISDTAFGNYRKDGLKAHKIGMEVYTRGNELIEFILSREGNCNLALNKKRRK